MSRYFNGFLDLAEHHEVGFVLDTQTWKARSHWPADLGASEHQLRDAIRDAVESIASRRAARSTHGKPIVLKGLIGPRGDASAPDEAVGVVRAAAAVGLPIVVSFTVETDGRLPTGQPLADAIADVDGATDARRRISWSTAHIPTASRS